MAHALQDIMRTAATSQAEYAWPGSDLQWSERWRPVAGEQAYRMEMPESLEELAIDSRWPAFFPSSISLVTTSDGKRTALEKVVGASIVNRFPYVIALSFCRRHLSRRHHTRATFMEVLEAGGEAAVQFLAPGPVLEGVMDVIATVPDEASCTRIKATGLRTRQAATNRAPIFTQAYMVYEARLVKPARDFAGRCVCERPWLDVGSHRVYFLEITAIQLREAVGRGRERIYWRSLPEWTPHNELKTRPVDASPALAGRYTKPYTPHYLFPSGATVAFEADDRIDGMFVKHLPALAIDQVEIDNDRARWPCFFPSSLGLITTWTENGAPNFMPCGSTTVVSRHPMVIAPCISYSAINERYARRATLDAIRKTNRFGCGVPYIHDAILGAIRYGGNISFASDPEKMARSGLEILPHRSSPLVTALPIHYDCEVIGEVVLGTHVMFLGEVREIQVRKDLSRDNPIKWCPWAEVHSPKAAYVG